MFCLELASIDRRRPCRTIYINKQLSTITHTNADDVNKACRASLNAHRRLIRFHLAPPHPQEMFGVCVC